MKPTCTGCGTATGWGVAIRTKPGKPLLCHTCQILNVRTWPNGEPRWT